MYDLVIEHARICDGTGTPSFLGTLGVQDGLITYLGTDTGLAAQHTIDADGLVLAPGFIDPHTHYDAHVDLLCDVGYATALLEIWVRQHQVLSLEKAVQKLTSVPAALFGIPHRGVLAAGKVADLVLFDIDRIASKRPEFTNDLPKGGRRLIAKSEGIEATFLAGTQLYDKGEHTGALPGRILRSYA